MLPEVGRGLGDPPGRVKPEALAHGDLVLGWPGISGGET